jgi:hypothetical protein
MRSFEECSVPEAPKEFIKLIREARKVVPRRQLPRPSLPSGDSLVSRREWRLLFQNQVFRQRWNRTGKLGDPSDSAYEYHLAKACLCCGLDQIRTAAVILKWREKHELKRSSKKLVTGIIPAAWCEVSPWVDGWHAAQSAEKEARKATKTGSIIRAHISEAGTPQTPSMIAAALSIPNERAKKAVQRMAKKGWLRSSKEGYIVGGNLGTFSCITTPL